jgi:hypothetical protein
MAAGDLKAKLLAFWSAVKKAWRWLRWVLLVVFAIIGVTLIVREVQSVIIGPVPPQKRRRFGPAPGKPGWLAVQDTDGTWAQVPIPAGKAAHDIVAAGLSGATVTLEMDHAPTTVGPAVPGNALDSLGKG